MKILDAVFWVVKARSDVVRWNSLNGMKVEYLEGCFICFLLWRFRKTGETALKKFS
jgi:hypothetical protein